MELRARPSLIEEGRMFVDRYDFVVAGGGASGLLAAGRAAELGLKVLLVEKMKRPCLKLLISGKGRCNVTNSASVEEFIKRIKPDGRFLRQAFNRFFSNHTVGFFESRGVPLRLERGGRYFPESGKAGDIVKALLNYCKTNGVTILTGSRVLDLDIEDSRVSGLFFQTQLSEKREYLSCRNMLLATGGQSYQYTGSTGDGYRLAALSGHTVTEIFPSQVPVDINFSYLSELSGLHLKNVLLSLWMGNRRIGDSFGEMLFTCTGVSGPIVLKLSRTVSEYFSSCERLFFEIDLKPAVEERALDARMLKRIEDSGKRNMLNFLKEFLPRQLIRTCCAINGIDGGSRALEINSQTRKKLIKWMKNFRLQIESVRPIDEAIVTAGGVSLKEVDPRTMQSRKVEGLFFSGELLDIDAETGGFNLQAAFSTGILAAEAAFKKNRL